MSEFDKDAFANTYGPIIFFGIIAVGFVAMLFAARADARALKAKIGPHVVGPDGDRWRIIKETCLNGDVWFVAERWRYGDWSAPYTTRFETAAAAQAWLDSRFDDMRAQLVATKERVFP